MAPPAVTERILHGTSNSPLPPSVEAAYYKKCIELKRRVEEIEGNNDKMRLSIIRHNNAIEKLRLERAFLLDSVRRQTQKGEEESEKSDSPPPTPQEKPTRIKRKVKMGTPTTDGPAGMNTSPAHAAHSTPPAASESATFGQYGNQGPSASSPIGPGGVQLPPIQPAPPQNYSNGNGVNQHGAQAESEDVTMGEDGAGYTGGFNAVNTR